LSYRPHCALLSDDGPVRALCIAEDEETKFLKPMLNEAAALIKEACDGDEQQMREISFASRQRKISVQIPWTWRRKAFDAARSGNCSM
jgi:hypothetical protein